MAKTYLSQFLGALPSSWGDRAMEGACHSCADWTHSSAVARGLPNPICLCHLPFHVPKDIQELCLMTQLSSRSKERDLKRKLVLSVNAYFLPTWAPLCLGIISQQKGSVLKCLVVVSHKKWLSSYGPKQWKGWDGTVKSKISISSMQVMLGSMTFHYYG